MSDKMTTHPQSPQSFDSWWPRWYDTWESEDGGSLTYEEVGNAAWEDGWKNAELDVLTREQHRWEVAACDCRKIAYDSQVQGEKE